MGKQAIARCGVCSKEIVMKVAWKKYCSKRCRLIAWGQRQGEERAAP